MKYLAHAVFALLIVLSTSTANAVEKKCKGDAVRATPPIPNRPTHIRNVVWRNTRAMCVQESPQAVKNPSNTTGTTTQPTSK